MKGEKHRCWKVRVDEAPGIEDKIVSWAQTVDIPLIVREDPDGETPNPHYHFGIRFDKECSQETVRNRVKDALKGEAKLDYATGVWDDSIDYLVYMCKGDDWTYVKDGKRSPHGETRPPKVIRYVPQVDGSGGFWTPGSLHERFWQRARDEYSPELRKNIKEKLPVLIEGWAQTIRKDPECTSYCAQQDAAMDLVIDFYKGKVQDHVAFPIIQSIMYKVNREHTVSDFKSRMFKKFSRI